MSAAIVYAESIKISKNHFKSVSGKNYIENNNTFKMYFTTYRMHVMFNYLFSYQCCLLSTRKIIANLCFPYKFLKKFKIASA